MVEDLSALYWELRASVATGVASIQDLSNARRLLAAPDGSVPGVTREQLEELYQETVKAFVAEFGEIRRQYWSPHCDAGVVMTDRDLVEVITPSDSGFEHPKLPAILSRLAVVGMKARLELSGDGKDNMIRRVFSTNTFLVDEITKVATDEDGSTDDDDDAPCQWRATRPASQVDVKGLDALVTALEAYFQASVAARARQSFIPSAFASLICIVLIGLVALNMTTPGDKLTTPYWLVIAGISGAIGSVTSVIIRLPREFERAQGIMRDARSQFMLLLAGFTRPWLGVVFGTLIQFVLVAEMTPISVPESFEARLAFLYVAAYIAGFGERWVHAAAGVATNNPPSTS